MSTVRRSNERIQKTRGRLDVGRINAATETDINRWRQEDGIDDSTLGPGVLVNPGPDLRRLRSRLGLSQEAFAERFGLSLRTVQDWEQQRRVPDGPARVLLRVIERDPDAVVRALTSGR